MDLGKFIEDLNDCFGPPFVDGGIVKARPDINGKGFSLQIGNRDIQFDEELNFIGRGTALNEPRVVMSGVSEILAECQDCSRWGKTTKWDS